MFRKSPTNTIIDMFNNIYEHLDTLRQNRLNDNKAWHNLFYQYITSQIDEKPFSCLFSEKMGAPNASIRILIAMMILKEGFGWSDEQLYEETDFDLRVMCSLGLNNISDEVPCIATYYNFKRSLYEYQVKNGEDLIGETFNRLTRTQAKLFGVNGKFARMDSKLLGSNIARCSRLQLVLSVINVFYKDISELGLTGRIQKEDLAKLEEWSNKKPGQIVYALTNEEKEKLLEELGYMLLRLQTEFDEGDSIKYHLLIRILSEQYSIEGAMVKLRDTKEISSGSLQSPYDEDAAYRNKKGQQVQGYSINITETCNEKELNLITDVKVEKANQSDNEFLQEAVERSQEIVGQIDNLNADGAYHSKNNQDFIQDNETQLILSGIQGRESNYEINIKSDEEIEFINKKTGEVHQAESYKPDRQTGEAVGYKIKENGKWRYFTSAFIHSYYLRKQVEQTPLSERNRRNNVEASIFQLCYRTRNNKTRYRGLIKHQFWASSRCMWINLVRIKNYLTTAGNGGVCPDGSKNAEKQGILAKAGELLTNFEGIFTSNLDILARFIFLVLFRNKKIVYCSNYI